jgi:glutamate-1-semialdehyde 2,1-aminomutase
MITLGKPVAGGIPAAAFGASQEIFDKTSSNMLAETTGVNGLGGTLTGNALALAAMRATLEKVITKKTYDRMIPLAKRFNEGIERTIHETGLPWHTVRLGARVEYRFGTKPPSNGAEAIATKDPLLNKYMHLYTLNRSILLTPFHNMALMSPYTTRKDVDLHTHMFRESVEELTS